MEEKNKNLPEEQNQPQDTPQQPEPEKKKKKRGKFSSFLLTAAITFLVVVLIVNVGFPQLMQWARRQGRDPFVVDDETFAALAPASPQHTALVDSLPQGSPDDTWAVYVYMVGSDLESQGRDYLSETTDLLLKSRNAEFDKALKEAQAERIGAFADTLKENGSFLPAALTMPDYDKEVEPSDEESGYTGDPGYGTLALQEMMNAELGDQVQIVVQTGGAKAWEIPDINPNRTQRFVVGNGRINEVYNGELENMGDPETLSGFLRWCKQNYPADHTIVLLWDHGGAARGFGWDEIFSDDNLSLKELRKAFSGAYTPNEQNPPIDLVYFNACLHSNAETANAMRGFARYMLACEEVEWGSPQITYLEAAFSTLAENPAMHPVQLARIITDNYIRTTLTLGEESGHVTPASQCTLDLTKAAETYDAYCALAGVMMDEAVEQPGLLPLLTRAARSSTFFAQSDYKYFNTIDLHNFMDGLAPWFPEETAAVQAAIEDSVLYSRATSYLKEAGGLSIYFPAYIEGADSLNLFLQYVGEISDSPDVNALYYYKVAGCLPDELEDHIRAQGYGELQALDFTRMKQCSNLAVSVDAAGGLSGQIPADALPLAADIYLQLARYDQDKDRLVYLGEDRYLDFDENGRIYGDFEGKWVTVGDTAFPVSVIDAGQADIKYQSHVRFKSFDRYLISRYVFETESMEILGIREFSDDADTLDRHLVQIELDDDIVPVYRTSDPDGGNLGTTEGSSFKFSESTAISDAPLPDGLYYMRAVIEDLRSDKYYSQIVEFTMKDGKITAPAVNTAARMIPVG